jgi:riboflavin synthase
MFTGLIQSVGKLTAITPRGNYRMLTIKPEPPFETLTLGESIACDGACLTVTFFDKTSFTVEASQETIARTIIAHYKVEARINLERALAFGDRLGGHFVTGHIDCIGVVKRCRKVGESVEFEVSFDSTHALLVIEKGSVAINGISLTVNECADDTLSVNIIPHSLEHTNLDDLAVKSKVNLEFDLLGKYVARMIGANYKKKNSLTIDKLIESGW